MADTTPTRTKAKTKTPDRLRNESHSAYKAFEIFAVLRNLDETKELYESENGDVRNSWRVSRSWPWQHDWFGRLGLEPLPQPETTPKRRSTKSKLPAPIEGAPEKLLSESELAYFAFSLFWRNIKADGPDRALTTTEADFRDLAPHKRHKIHTWKFAHNWWERVGIPEKAVEAAQFAQRLDLLTKVGNGNVEGIEAEIRKLNAKPKPLDLTNQPRFPFQQTEILPIKAGTEAIEQLMSNSLQSFSPRQIETISFTETASCLVDLLTLQLQAEAVQLQEKLAEIAEIIQTLNGWQSTQLGQQMEPFLFKQLQSLTATLKPRPTESAAIRRALKLLTRLQDN